MASLVECQCCFQGSARNKTISCDSGEGHRFCFSCAKSSIEASLQILKIDLKCISITNCIGKLPESKLSKFLDADTLSRFCKVQQQLLLRSLYKDNIVTCPFCSFDMVQDEGVTTTVLLCLNDDCKRESCILCKKDSHLDSECINEDVQRIQKEEDDTYKVIKACPTCNVDIYRTDGCTHMTCTICNKIMCYMCGVDITLTMREHGCELYPERNRTRTVVNERAVEDLDLQALRIQDNGVNEVHNYNRQNINVANRQYIPPAPAYPPSPVYPAVQYNYNDNYSYQPSYVQAQYAPVSPPTSSFASYVYNPEIYNSSVYGTRHNLDYDQYNPRKYSANATYATSSTSSEESIRRLERKVEKSYRKLDMLQHELDKRHDDIDRELDAREREIEMRERLLYDSLHTSRRNGKRRAY